MKRKHRITIPTAVFSFIAIILIVLSIYLSFFFRLPENIVYISSLFAMPEGLSSGIMNIKNDITEKLQLIISGKSYEIDQKGGSINDIEKRRQFSDLTVTPDDIAENEIKIQKQFETGKYIEDGEVIEETYISYQATDMFENVFVRNVTVNSDIDVEGIIKNGCKLPVVDYSEPTVLIYHTHSTESYIMSDNGKFSSDYPGRSDDKDLNMIRVGEEIAAVLEARDIGVIHDKTIYDSVYTGAYEKSRDGINQIMEKYPSIIITLDIHRDAIYYDDLTRVKPVAEVNSEKAAQMMIIAGAEGGNVENFEKWETNLSFAINLQKSVNNKYENLMKPIYFCNRKYNMDITPYSLLIEVGTDVNTLSEAAYSGRLLGDVLSDYIKENAKESEND